MLVNRANSALKFTEPYKAITRKVSIWYILIPIPEFYYRNCDNSGPSRVVYSEALPDFRIHVTFLKKL
jgi:hypothetical protein